MPTILTTKHLRESGLTRARIAALVGTGRLVRIRAGHYATPQADGVAVAAVAIGCTITCGAALRRHGAWVLDRATHLRLPPGARRRSGRRAHRLGGHSVSGVDDIATALDVATRCFSHESLVATVDSLLHRGLMPLPEVRSVLGGTAAGRRALAHMDARAESGLESIVRVRLRARRIMVRPQARIAGVGRVDLLVGRRLVIELDGDEWHSTPEQRDEDRRRDNRLRRLGYIVLRYGYRRALHEWDAVLDDVLDFVRRGAHLDPPRGSH